MKSAAGQITKRVIVCLLIAPTMYWPLWQGGYYMAAIVGCLLAVCLYLIVQLATRFRHPLHGAFLAVFLAAIYSIWAACVVAIGGMGR